MTPFLRYNITSKIASEKTTESITPNPSVWHPNKWGTTGDSMGVADAGRNHALEQYLTHAYDEGKRWEHGQ